MTLSKANKTNVMTRIFLCPYPKWVITYLFAGILGCLFGGGILFADTASFYGNGEKLNKHTANGEVFNPNDLTCATYAYDFGTKLRVTNLANRNSVIVRVNDRGPNKRLNRLIDLSRRAFEEISELRKGLIEVKVEEL